jgi:hypothetical protein
MDLARRLTHTLRRAPEVRKELSGGGGLVVYGTGAAEQMSHPHLQGMTRITTILLYENL